MKVITDEAPHKHYLQTRDGCGNLYRECVYKYRLLSFDGFGRLDIDQEELKTRTCIKAESSPRFLVYSDLERSLKL